MGATLTDAITELIDGKSLGAHGAAMTLAAILDGGCAPEQIAGFLVAMAAKGPTPEELVGFLDTMTSRCVPLELPAELHDRAVDVVGTGGDHSGSVNVSTIAALVVAGAGVPAVKHGSRAATSSVGAADVLEAAGVTIAPGPVVVARSRRPGSASASHLPSIPRSPSWPRSGSPSGFARCSTSSGRWRIPPGCRTRCSGSLTPCSTTSWAS